MKPKFFIQTFGCQMNKNDSERIAGLLKSVGFLESKNADKADVLIINTCSVRQSAEDRVFGTIKNWQILKRKNPRLIIAVTGCMPGRDKDGTLKRKLKGVDLFFGIDELPRLPNWLNELNSDLFIDRKKIRGSLDYLNIIPERKNKYQGFISIQTGCNNFCAYCVVPYARGRERNRPVKDILKEVNCFTRKGGLEITLLGQVVNHYIAPDPNSFSANNPFGKKDDFASLLWELNQIKKLQRIHFTAPHPKYFNDFQIEALKLLKQINYLHLPAQSGDDAILKKMNRGYLSKEYIELIKKIRCAKPDIAIGTDLIIGFCEETEKQFQNTIKFYNKCDFDIAYAAIYSPRLGTVAHKNYKDSVDRKIKKERWNKFQKMMEKLTYKKNQEYIGKAVQVLVESCDKEICAGYSREMKLVQFVGKSSLVGKIVFVKIFEAKEWVLKGEVLKYENNKLPKILAIIGPTASGKTNLSLSLAKKFNGEIINADSRQVYKEMNVATAKEKKDKNKKDYFVKGIKHYLIDVANPDDEFTLAHYKKSAIEAIDNILKRKKLPIIVGGTGLYVKAIVENYDIPAVGPNLCLREKLGKKNLSELTKMLKKSDPKAYKIIDLKNPRRIIRALELALSGKAKKEKNKKTPQLYETLQIGLNLSRQQLYERINNRVDKQIKEGLVAETKKLANKYSFELPSMSGIGYKQIGYYLRNNISLPEAIEMIKRDTRHYAKRQMTWLKKEKNIKWVKNSDEAKKLVDEFIKSRRL